MKKLDINFNQSVEYVLAEPLQIGEDSYFSAVFTSPSVYNKNLEFDNINEGDFIVITVQPKILDCNDINNKVSTISLQTETASKINYLDENLEKALRQAKVFL